MFFKFVNNFEPSLAGSHNPLTMGTIVNTIAACELRGMHGCIDRHALHARSFRSPVRLILLAVLLTHALYKLFQVFTLMVYCCYIILTISHPNLNFPQHKWIKNSSTRGSIKTFVHIWVYIHIFISPIRNRYEDDVT